MVLVEAVAVQQVQLRLEFFVAQALVVMVL
jgi:hypothetical protein